MSLRLTLGLVLLLVPSIAAAQSEDSAVAPADEEPAAQLEAVPQAEAEAAAPDPNEEEARALFIAGRAAFGRGELERALQHFTHARELSDRPGLLFNIGNTHDRLRHDELAIEFLTAYLEALPEASNADFVRSRIEVLRANVAERASADADLEEREAAHAAERERLESVAATAGEVDATVSDAGIGLMIGGGIGLLVSIGPGVWLAQSSAALNNCRPTAGCDVRAAVGRRDAATALTVSFIVASLLTGGGGILLFAISPRPGDEEAVEVACRSTLAGVGCSGRF